MRKYIEEQLKNCVFVNITDINTKNPIIIPKYSKPKYDVGKSYLIQIPATIVNNPNSILASNWNNGRYPVNSYMKAYVSKMIGKMIYIDGLAYDFDNKKDLEIMWSGWLPIDELTQISEIV